MARKNNKDFDDGMRWYHALFAWMIIIPFFLIAVIPEGFWSLPVVGLLILSGILGVVLIVKVPLKYKNKANSKEG